MCTLWQILFFSLFFSIQVLGSSVLYAITIVFELKKKRKKERRVIIGVAMPEKKKGVSPFARLRWPVSWHNGHFLSLSATTVEGTKSALQVGLAATMRRLHHLFCSLHSLSWHLWQRLRKKQKTKRNTSAFLFSLQSCSVRVFSLHRSRPFSLFDRDELPSYCKEKRNDSRP